MGNVGDYHGREHAIEWGAHPAQDPSTGLNPACHDRNACSNVSFSTATRTVKNGWTVSRFHRICWDLIIRFALIWFTADSAKAVEIGPETGAVVGQRIRVPVQIGQCHGQRGGAA
jgi:hypothetical protein